MDVIDKCFSKETVEAIIASLVSQSTLFFLFNIILTLSTRILYSYSNCRKCLIITELDLVNFLLLQGKGGCESAR